ncbi:MAG TPA: YihY/virulence factor BrkB family protein [Actinomycetota bacterium]|nr:YihY/virulence factor BrkB family protein [Actinomycetota bacterium]
MTQIGARSPDAPPDSAQSGPDTPQSDERELIPAPSAGEADKESPRELTKQDWKLVLKRTAAEMKNDHGTLIGAGVAFYWFLAIFPGLIAAVGILDLVDAGSALTNGIQDVIRSALPGEAAQILTKAVSGAASGKERASLIATLIGIALALWSASTGMVALQAGLDVSYDVKVERTFFKKRLYGVLLVIMTAVFGGLAAGLLIFGKPSSRWIIENLPAGRAFGVAWDLFRWGVALVGLIVLVATYYYFGPNRRKPSWQWITPGGILATVGWLLVSKIFSFYVRTFGEESYAQTYASLVGVVVLLFWMYLSVLVILLGAELNGQLERRNAERSGKLPPGDYMPDGVVRRERLENETSKGRRSLAGKVAAVLLVGYAFKRKNRGG